MKTKQLGLSLILLVFIINGANAQSLNSIFNKYGSKPDFELVTISKPMLTLARTFSDKETKEVLSKISNMKILTSDKTKLNSSLMNDVQSLVKRESFESILEVRDKGERVMIYLKDRGSKKTDIVIVTNDNEGANLIWFSGKLSLSDIENLRGINL